MTLITIAQNTLREINGFEVPTTLVGNDNETAVLSLALINRALLETQRRANWGQTTVRHRITTVAGQEEYDLPSDFKQFLTGTWWDADNRWRVFGPASPAEWAALQARAVTGSVRRFVRIFRGTASNDRKIYFFPVPASDGDSIDVEYLSNGIVQDSGGNLKERFTADDDTSLIDEDVIALGFKWRFLKSNGLPHAEEFRDYEMAVADLKGDDGGALLDYGASNLIRSFGVQEGDFPS